MKILLVNSDLAKNRGDRAITEGVVSLIKSRNPNAQITGISEHAKRDSHWFGISFLEMDAQSLNPLDILRLLKKARQSDAVYWGGGELLKDYTNKAALWYWVVKMWLVSLANPRLYGLYQGIGPTYARSSKIIIRFIVNRCRGFVVRDPESYEKLVAWGCKNPNLLTAADPAILPAPQPLSGSLKAQLMKEFSIDSVFLKNYVCIGPRDWFHYKQGGLLPYKYKRLLGLGKTSRTSDQRHEQYMRSLQNLCDYITQKGHNIIFVPMHMGEEDIQICRELCHKMTKPEQARVLDKDTISPADIRSIISGAKAMVGFRLHSTILATSTLVPSMTYYYVDKGRAYFKQIKQERFAFPIESLLDEQFETEYRASFETLLASRQQIRKELSARLLPMRKLIRQTFDTMIADDD